MPAKMVLILTACVILGGSGYYIVWNVPRLWFGGAVPAGRFLPLPATIVPIVLAPGALIVCEGDSITYGADRLGRGARINGAGSPRVTNPYPETLATLLDNDVRVENRGYPGDTAAVALGRWAGKPSGELAIIMYGTNDANPRGHGGGAVPLDRFRSDMKALVRRRADEGAQVIVIAPPPSAIASAEAAISPYRTAARTAALEAGAMFIDPAALLRGVAAPIQIDGIHLRSAGTVAIARGLSGRIEIERSGAGGARARAPAGRSRIGGPSSDNDE